MSAPAFEMPSADTAQYLALCDATIAETQALIRELEAGKGSRSQRRRDLFKARRKLGQLQAAADRVRRATGAA